MERGEEEQERDKEKAVWVQERDQEREALTREITSLRQQAASLQDELALVAVLSACRPPSLVCLPLAVCL
jgi:predicted  nucleic acid-binding Zn-ribbon protein